MKYNHLVSAFLLGNVKQIEKERIIYIRVTVDGEEKEFPTKEQIETNNRNRNKGIVKGNSIFVKSINDYLENIKFNLKEKYRKLLDASELVTAGAVMDAYHGTQAQLKGHQLKICLPITGKYES